MESSVHRAQEELIAALLRADGETLDALVAPDCRIIGPKGFVTSKEEWIGTHLATTYTQVRIENIESDVRVYGGTAIRWDVQESVCIFNGETIEGRSNVTGVWVRDGERWQLRSLQYTACPS